MNEEIERSTASELDGLPDVDRKETQDILDEIGKEEKENAEKTPDPEKPKEEEPAKDPKPEEKKPDERKPDEKKPDRKPPTLMPRYVHEIAVKEAVERENALKAEIERLSNGKVPPSEEKSPDPSKQEALKGKIADIADKLSSKHQGVSKELIHDLASSLVELGLSPAQIPPEILKKLEAVDAFKAEQEVKAEETAFNAAFDEKVLPLIKGEYGDLPEDTISEIRKKMMERAYSDEFAKTPYDVIYKGVDDFRGFKRMSPKSSEESRGGHERNSEAAPGGDDSRFASMTEADIDKMSTEEFERYSQWAEAQEKSRR